jgi:hypothetical protein
MAKFPRIARIIHVIDWLNINMSSFKKNKLKNR